MHPFVRAVGIPETLLDRGGEADTLCHVLVLQKLEDDVAFRGVRVESGIPLLVVVFDEDYRILFLGHFQVLLRAVQSEGISLRTADAPVSGSHRIGMDGDKEVGLRVIGYFSSSVQGDEHISFAGIDHTRVRTVLPDQPSQFECYAQVDVFFLSSPS